jgi:putative chitinase
MEIALVHLQRVCRFTHTELLEKALPYLNASFAPAQIETPIRAAMYLAQVAHETAGFSRLEENLNYSAEALCRTWPHRFPTLDVAELFAHNPEKLGNEVYALRMGNGDRESGEGYRYRGRGGPMLTGRDAYKACQESTGIPLLDQPELAAHPEYAFRVAAWFWVAHRIGELADKGDVRAVTLRWNGGLIGLSERQLNFDKFCEQLGVVPLAVA